MSKIVQFHELGGPEVLKLVEAPLAQPGPGNVRLKVKACGLNRAEALFMRGQYFEKPKLPSRICYEASGIVDAVGEGVDKAWLGKNVATVPGFSMSDYGVLGEQAVVPARVLAEYPESMSYAEGAAVWMQYLTAYCGLVHLGEIAAGDFVVITAASSSVGLAAIQTVKAEGGLSIATTRTSAKKAELLELGADHVIATAEEDFVARVNEITGGKGARLIFDPVAGPFVDNLVTAVAPGGIIFIYGNLSREPTPFSMATLSKGVWMRGYTLAELYRVPGVLDTAKTYVHDRLKDRRFVPKISRTFPLSQVKEAYEYLESNAQVGKVVVTV